MGEVSDSPFVSPNARLCVLLYTVRGAEREATLPGGREEWLDCLITGLPFPLSFGEGQRQQPHTGAKGVFFLWGREGQWEGPHREGARELSGKQPVYLGLGPSSLHNPPWHGGSDLQLGSRLQLAGMRPAGHNGLPSEAGLGSGGAKASTLPPCI